jgi:hypothetical protein
LGHAQTPAVVPTRRRAEECGDHLDLFAGGSVIEE